MQPYTVLHNKPTCQGVPIEQPEAKADWIFSDGIGYQDRKAASPPQFEWAGDAFSRTFVTTSW